MQFSFSFAVDQKTSFTLQRKFTCDFKFLAWIPMSSAWVPDIFFNFPSFQNASKTICVFCNQQTSVCFSLQCGLYLLKINYGLDEQLVKRYRYWSVKRWEVTWWMLPGAILPPQNSPAVVHTPNGSWMYIYVLLFLSLGKKTFFVCHHYCYRI